jgi:hypothetical protein
MHIKAVEVMMKNGGLPCNVKVMIEGEEEVGSNNLGVFVKANKERLKADVVLISDTAMIANDVPSINTGLRGLSYVEVEVTGPNRDLHSGVYGGAVANPINALCEMIASLHDADRRITIPGFYDTVNELSKAERDALAEAPFDEEAYMKDLAYQRRARRERATPAKSAAASAHVGRERHLGRLHRRRRQDRAAQQGLRQTEHALWCRTRRAMPSPNSSRTISNDRAAGHHRGGEAAPWWRSGRDPDRLAGLPSPPARPWKRPSARSPSPRAAAEASPSWRSSKRNWA